MGSLPLQSLAIAVLVYYTPATAASGWLCYRLGIGKQWGWLALLVLGLLRVVASALRLATKDEDSGIARGARYIPTIGTVAILLAMLELLDRLRRSLPNLGPVLDLPWRVLYWAQLAAFIISIVGAALGLASLVQAFVCIIAAIFIILIGITSLFTRGREQLSATDQRILTITLASIPFLVVRVLYAVLSAFGPGGTAFDGREPDVYAQAFMQYFMEFIVVSLFLVAGNLLRREKKNGTDRANLESGKLNESS